MQILKAKIIGVALFLGLLLVAAPMAHAIYSPVLSREVGEVKQHVLAARQQNGVGSWLNAMEKVSANNKVYKKEGWASGIPGLLYSYWAPVQEIFYQAATESFLDGFTMLFYSDLETNGTITACLRDDIWEIQALEEEVLNELFKSALLNDSVNSAILWNDYKRLDSRIAGNNDDYTRSSLKRDWASTIVWFPDGGTNYYADCPFGDITMALDAVSISWERLFSGDTYFQMGSMSMASMWSAAEQRAVKRAADYIKKNQIKVSLGGAPGANPEGLVSKNLGGDLVTAFDRAVAAYDSFHAGELIGSIGKSAGEEATAFAKIFQGRTSSEVLAEYQATWNARKQDLSRISNSLTFSLQLNHVSEQGLMVIERKMLEINEVIKAGVTQKALPKMCKEVNRILKKQCPGKASNEPVSCEK